MWDALTVAVAVVFIVVITAMTLACTPVVRRTLEQVDGTQSTTRSGERPDSERRLDQAA